MTQEIRKVLIIGAGTMGHGIAQVTATAGVQVALHDPLAAALTKATDKIRWSLAKLAEKGKLTEPVDTVLARITPAAQLTAETCAVDLVIEAAPEKEEIKREIFGRVDGLCAASTILVSNTSAIPISRLAAATKRPGQFCGMHFFNPVPLMALVEVIRGTATSAVTLAAAEAFVRQIGKEPVSVAKDVPGFVVNRVLLRAVVEAVQLVEREVATAADVDKAMRLGCGWKMGPLETSDLAGLDVCQYALEAIQKADGDAGFAPPKLLRDLVAKGHLGRKSGKGFYDHAAPTTGASA